MGVSNTNNNSLPASSLSVWCTMFVLVFSLFTGTIVKHNPTLYKITDSFILF